MDFVALLTGGLVDVSDEDWRTTTTALGQGDDEEDPAVGVAASTPVMATLSLDMLPPELLRLVFSFLDCQSLGRVEQVCRQCRKVCAEGNYRLWLEEIARRLQCRASDVALDREHCEPGESFKTLCRELHVPPTKFFQESLRYTVGWEGSFWQVGVDDSSFWLDPDQDCESDRVVCADKAFPKLLDGSAMPASTRLCMVDGKPSRTLGRYPVLYYEIQVGGRVVDRPRDTENECLSLGLGSSEFPSGGAQPGWLPLSYGYHGDDGHFYAWSGTGHNFGPGFGDEGDVIGCGLNYAGDREIFFTLNGKAIGHAVSGPTLFRSDLFPVCGVGLYSRVTWNFGSQPFRYDPSGWEQDRERLARPPAVSQRDLRDIMLLSAALGPGADDYVTGDSSDEDSEELGTGAYSQWAAFPFNHSGSEMDDSDSAGWFTTDDDEDEYG
eukprot:m.44954 g.44954  ORF g.44954 m.44954 type:complete len:438 (+) comp11745_c0_seq2:334-1647(+)